MKKAFTLIELLVVIGIIGILAGVMLSQFGGMMDSSRLTKCETNLRNLGMAANAVHMGGRYPHAGSTEYSRVVRTGRRAKTYYYEHKGWISWLSEGKYRSGQPPTSHQSISYCSFANDDLKQREFALTNGAIWTAISGNRSCYVCPCHQKACLAKGVDPAWSYVMNARFGFDYSKGSKTTDTQSGGIYTLQRADRTLMFAEIPCIEKSKAKANSAMNFPDAVLTGGTGDSRSDSVLQYKDADGWSGSAESIGFNHRVGKRYVGTVCFADGHTERITLPKDGQFVELTKWLCEGTDVTFVNDSYEHYTGEENSAATDN